jgi:hypothetical protein
MKPPLQGALFFISLTEDNSQLSEPPVPPTPPTTVADNTEDSDPYVPFTTQIRLSSFLKLKQAHYWEPGFGEMREHVNEAVATYLTQLPGSTKPLPAKEVAKNKILRDNSGLLDSM